MKEYFRTIIRHAIRSGARTGDLEDAVRDILAVLLLLKRETRKEMEAVMVQELSDQGIPEQEIQRMIAKAKEDGKEWFDAYDSRDENKPAVQKKEYCFKSSTFRARPEVREVK